MTNRARVPIVGTVISESAVCAVLIAAARGIHRTRDRITLGLGARALPQGVSATSQTLDRLASDSRLIGGLSALITTLPMAWAEGRVKQWADPFVRADLSERIRMSGVIIIIAVVTHSALLAALGVPVREVGWGMRAILLALGLFAAKRPEAFAAAWNYRSLRPRKAPRR